VVEEGLPETPDEPDLPRRPTFAVGRLAAESSPDAALPPPLPLMARPVADRVSLDDGTGEVRTAAVLAAPLPRRTAPAPFVRTGVPQPFADRRPLTMKIPEEETSPVVEAPSGVR
jgi:hypothetical protein